MTDDAARQDSFQVYAADGDSHAASLLGLWDVVLAPPRIAEFGLASAAGNAVERNSDVPEWRITLPGEAQRAGALLDDAEAILDVNGAALPEALDRVEQFGQAAGTMLTTAPSRAIDAQAEVELIELLSGFGADIAPHVDGQPGSLWRRLLAELRAVVGRLRLGSAPSALVRTYAGERCVGVTAIRRPGGLTTLCRADLGPEAALHSRAVAVVLASHTALLQTIAVALRGASIVMTAFAMPLGPLLALPAAWQLVQAVQAEARLRRRPLDTYHEM